MAEQSSLNAAAVGTSKESLAMARATLDRLRAELAAITTYIPPALVRQQLADPVPGRVSGAYWDGSVLFADMSGFTALSEKLSALGKQGSEEISAIINSLFAALVEEVHFHGGGLLKFGGDALTAFFDAATLGEDHAALAGNAALAMQRRMARFAALRTRAGTFTLRLRIGVHSGRVFAAQVGTTEHIELVVTGRTINRVALAQEIAEPGEVVISDETSRLLRNAITTPRENGFAKITGLPTVELPTTHSLAVDTASYGTLERAINALTARIAALRPYLPYGLPQRFLDLPHGVVEAGEFRPVSVLFANFHDFSAILDALGEDVHTAARVLNAYYQRAQEVIHRYGGIVNKVDMYTHGDKLMALFGAPVAHEDDPERAVRAALDLRQALDAANEEIAVLLDDRRLTTDDQYTEVEAVVGRQSSVVLQQKVGINTGVVFAGQVGSAQRREYTVMGQHVNLSARLMSASSDGAVTISPSTRRAVEHAITLGELPPVRLKGIAEPVPIAQALAPRTNSARRRSRLRSAALVGRDAELQELLAQSITSLYGAGRALAVVADAGLGKTRLLEELIQQLVLRSGNQVGAVPDFLIYTAECQSYSQRTPYALARSLLGQFFNLGRANDAAAIMSRIERLAPDLVRFAPLLGELLRVAIEDTPLTASLSPEQRHDRVLELVEALLLAEAKTQPLVLFIDDLHWGDASSLEILQRLAESAPQAPLLLLFGYRPDQAFQPPGAELASVTILRLRELPAEASLALVRELLDGEPPPGLEPLIERAQGNPFFLEEVVRGLVESAVLVDEGHHWRLSRALDESSLPGSIEGVITARLDRIDDRSREILQVGAVIGRRFTLPVLSVVAPPLDDLIEHLDALVQHDLLVIEQDERDLTHQFRQSMTRDVAYESILYARRRDLHRRTADWLTQLYYDHLDDQLAVLARHYLLAEDWESAFAFHLRAGRHAQERYANREAIELFGQALQIGLQIVRDDDDEEYVLPENAVENLADAIVELHERMGDVRTLIGEYDTALDHYQSALAQVQRGAADVRVAVRLHHQIARLYGLRGEYDPALEWIERGMALPNSGTTPALVSLLVLGASLNRRKGRVAQALDWAERSLPLAEQVGNLSEQARAYRIIGNLRLGQGDTRAALDSVRKGLALYEKARDLSGIADAHNELANVFFDIGELAEARSNYEAADTIKQAIGDIYGQGMIACNLGELFRLQDDLEAAIDQYERGLSIYQSIGSNDMSGLLEMNLGAAHLLRGEYDLAAEHLARSSALFEQAGAEDYLAELERHRAELALRTDELAAARAAALRSIEYANRNDARAEEGMTRRVLGLIAARNSDLPRAWAELQQAINILQEAGNRHETARAQIVLADIAPFLHKQAEGQKALSEAITALHAIGARRDLNEAAAVAARHGWAAYMPPQR
jgi:class 3 adenylate cyclase/tetratricopeptide (TPR) repeat protein